MPSTWQTSRKQRSLLQARLESRHVAEDDAPPAEFYQPCSLELIQDLGDRFPQRPDHIAQLLVRDWHRLPASFLAEPQEDSGDARRNAAVGHLFQPRLAEGQPPA